VTNQKAKREEFMKKLINGVDTVLEESLDGFAAAHTDILVLGPERKFLRRRDLKAGKSASSPAEAPAMSRCMQALSVSVCSMPPAPVRCSPRRRPTR
jgi:hypothetical protein